MKIFFFLFLVSNLSLAQFITEYPDIQNTNNSDLEILKVENSLLKTALTFKYTHRKRKEKNILANLLGINGDKIRVCINSNTFLVDTVNSKKYKIYRAINIPFCSVGGTVLANNQSLIFELYFEKLNPGIEVFNFKEGNFHDTVFVNRNTWRIAGVQAENPKEGEKSKIKTKKSKSNNFAKEVGKDENVFYFVETEANLMSFSEQEFQNFLKANLENLQKANSIILEGHTDRIGDYFKNRKLSLERAETIKNYMLKENIDPNKILIRGFSHLKILTWRRDELSKLKNRRVEIKVI